MVNSLANILVLRSFKAFFMNASHFFRKLLLSLESDISILAKFFDIYEHEILVPANHYWISQSHNHFWRYIPAEGMISTTRKLKYTFREQILLSLYVSHTILNKVLTRIHCHKRIVMYIAQQMKISRFLLICFIHYLVLWAEPANRFFKLINVVMLCALFVSHFKVLTRKIGSGRRK